MSVEHKHRTLCGKLYTDTFSYEQICMGNVHVSQKVV